MNPENSRIINPKELLFNFSESWKMNVLNFMANYTGRNLAILKRDFKKISDLSPPLKNNRVYHQQQFKVTIEL